MEKKYCLTKNTKIIDGITLYQIQALKDFSSVKKGDLWWLDRKRKKFKPSRQLLGFWRC